MKRWMRRSGDWATDLVVFAVCVTLALLWNTCEAHAQDSPLPDVSAPCAPEVAEGQRSALIPHEGRSGRWFDMEVARCMLGRLEALPRYADRLHLLEERLRLGDERHELMQREVRLAVQESERATSALEAAERGRREAEEESQFERSLRWVWFGVGVVVVVAVEALAIWAISELDL